ncbi:MAG: hypothetical protein GX802_04000 [Clostridiales bacterium]|nr:hypothetical protein [Clostridiales bacterium]
MIETPELDIYAYKDGVFTEIEEAYESGMLTKKDISDIAGQISPDKYRNKN